jgi:hypothetical protein
MDHIQSCPGVSSPRTEGGADEEWELMRHALQRLGAAEKHFRIAEAHRLACQQLLARWAEQYRNGTLRPTERGSAVRLAHTVLAHHWTDPAFPDATPKTGLDDEGSRTPGASSTGRRLFRPPIE